MSLTIGGVIFDHYTGTLRLPQKRTVIFAPAHTAHIGSRVLPKVGKQSQLVTQRFQIPASNLTIVAQLDALINDTVVVTENGIDYATTHQLKFVIEDVEHEVATIPGVVSYRSTGLVNLSPAGRVVSTWKLRAVPAS